MSDSSESFRNELVAKLLDSLPQDQVKNILSVVDATITGYDITRKPVGIITTEGIPEVVKYFIASKSINNLSMKTLNIYRLRLIDFFETIKKPFQDITANDIRRYLNYCKETRKNSNRYLDNIRRELNSFFSWLVLNDALLRNPCSTVDCIKYQEKAREPLTPYELEELRYHCKSIREKCIIDFFFSTGVRLSELHDLNISDIDWTKRSVIIRHGKGDKRRVVFFNAESELTLRKYLESRTDDCEALIVTDRRPYRRLCIKGIEDVVTKVAKRAEMHVYPHKLRHTFATSGIHRGVPLDKIQALMGHTDPKTTLIYAKQDTLDLQYEHKRAYA